jgi:hypothetical protein
VRGLLRGFGLAKVGDRRAYASLAAGHVMLKIVEPLLAVAREAMCGGKPAVAP